MNIIKYNNLSFIDQLILELKKKTYYETRFLNRSNHSNEIRDTSKIVILLQTIPRFAKFMKNNKIDQNSLNMASGSIRYLFVKKGDHLFCQNDRAVYFYGIIKGTVSIRIRRNFNKLMNDSKLHYIQAKKKDKRPVFVYEEEILSFTDGDCLGQWGMMDNKPRSTSAVAAEDTHFFLVDKETFDSAFKHSLKKSESERRIFLCNELNLGVFMQSQIFETFFKGTVCKTPFRGETIFKSGDEANALFIVYKGEFEYFYKDKDICKTVLIVGRGKLVGLEVFDSPKMHKYNLRASSESSVLIEIPYFRISTLLSDSTAFFLKKKTQNEAMLNHFYNNIREENKRRKGLAKAIEMQNIVKGIQERSKIKKPSQKIVISKVDLHEFKPIRSNKKKTTRISRPIIGSKGYNAKKVFYSHQIQSKPITSRVSMFNLDDISIKSSARKSKLQEEPAKKRVKTEEDKFNYPNKKVLASISQFKNNFINTGRMKFPLLTLQ